MGCWLSVFQAWLTIDLLLDFIQLSIGFMPPEQRVVEIRKYINPSALGLEVGPLHNPICPKADGCNCLSYDFLSRDELLAAYAKDERVMSRCHLIEEVDIVSRHCLGEALAEYSRLPHARIQTTKDVLGYVVSSHNFEHIPDPIGFLQDVAQALRVEGWLSMAIPVGSRCFDCLRPLSTSGQLIDAFHERRRQPTLGSVFDGRTLHASMAGGGDIAGSAYNLDQVAVGGLDGLMEPPRFEELAKEVSLRYVDSHCFVYNPFSFLLIIEELQACGFFPDLRLIEVVDPGTHEFFVHFAKAPSESRIVFSMTSSRRSELIKRAIAYQFDDLLQPG